MKNKSDQSENKKVALVTGANKGIGFELAKELAFLGHIVILTSRDESKGKLAVKNISLPNIHFHKLDINSDSDIDKLYAFVEKKFGKLDILINNSGILVDFYKDILNVNREELRETLETNVIGTLRVSQKFIPLMKKNNYGRILNVSSGYGQLSGSPDGIFCPAYRVSKTALNMVTKLLAKSVSGSNILINCACPGWVRTDMGGKNAELSIEEGANNLIWLSLLPDKGPSGKYFIKKKEESW